MGVLINLSLSSESKELMATTPQFYQVLYQVLASYQDQKFLVDYCLKLVLNTADHQLAFQNYISG